MADDPAPAVPSVDAGEVLPRLDRLTEKVSLLEQLIVRRIQNDQIQQQAFNALHAELQQYKSDAQRAAQKPILKGMILIYDATMRLLEQVGGDRSAPAVETVAEEILELLHRHDVDLIAEQPERFDNRIQMAIRTEPAPGPEDDQRVAQIVRQGFRWGGQVLRPQEVVVKVFKKP